MKTDRFKKFIEKYKFVLLPLIILFCVCRLIFIFSQRDGHHIDEVWSYGYANSYFEPHIFTSSMIGRARDRSELKNIGVWISGETFKDYLTVSADDRFSFDSVIYNKSQNDNSAFYEILLHFVCSLFPEHFSWSYPFAINVILFILTIIFAYLLSYQITKSVICSLGCVLYFALSGCGTATFLYLRIYPLFTFMAVLFTYYFLVGINKDLLTYKDLIILLIIAILGYYSHIYFLLIAFSYTFLGAILLLFKKKYSSFFRLCYTMLISVLIFFALRPYPIASLISSAKGNDPLAGHVYAYPWQLSIANMHFFKDTLGFYINFTVPLIVEMIGIIAFFAFLVAVIAFLFRKESWMTMLQIGMGKILKNVKSFCRGMHVTSGSGPFIVIASSVFYILVVAKTASLVRMGFVDRYFFAAMSVFEIVFISLIVMASAHIFDKSKIVSILICLVLAVMVANTGFFTDYFKFTGYDEAKMHDDLTGRNCLVLITRSSDLTWLSPILLDSGDVFVEYSEEMIKDNYDFPGLKEGDYVLLNTLNFISEEESLRLEEDDAIEVSDMINPNTLYTSKEYIEKLETKSGLRYRQVKTYSYYYELYECIGE